MFGDLVVVKTDEDWLLPSVFWCLLVVKTHGNWLRVRGMFSCLCTRIVCEVYTGKTFRLVVVKTDGDWLLASVFWCLLVVETHGNWLRVKETVPG